jgi:hypothetical protein
MSLDLGADNPFWVLELAPAASHMEVERAGKRILALLAVQHPAASTFACALPHDVNEQTHRRPRDEQLVRTAVAALRDPATRTHAAAWLGFAPFPPLPPPADGKPALRALQPSSWRAP